MDPNSMHTFAAEIKRHARALGFDLVGIAPAEQSKYRDYYRHWLDTGQHGAMEYLSRRFDERTNPAVYLPGAQSVICVAMNYHAPLQNGHASRDTGVPPVLGAPENGSCSYPSATHTGETPVSLMSPPAPHPASSLSTGESGGLSRFPHVSGMASGGEGTEERSVSAEARVARYALGDDYHDVLKTRLHQLADWIRSKEPTAQTRAAVDTAPVMEKELAARAGVGWMGKNTCIINEAIGSWLFLGETITTLELPPDDPAIDRCGTCRRCIDACPTQAITAPYQLDARKCISYLTIELREDIPHELRNGLGDWLYGCDICQDVRPWNSRAPDAQLSAFQPRLASGKLNLRQVLNWRNEEYRDALRGSAMKRVKLPILQRNAQIVLENLARGGA
jgi:epoxyqueuosine reductase